MKNHLHTYLKVEQSLEKSALQGKDSPVIKKSNMCWMMCCQSWVTNSWVIWVAKQRAGTPFLRTLFPEWFGVESGNERSMRSWGRQKRWRSRPSEVRKVCTNEIFFTVVILQAECIEFALMSLHCISESRVVISTWPCFLFCIQTAMCLCVTNTLITYISPHWVIIVGTIFVSILL